MRVLIVGGGAIGCALARHLARAGAEVVVLERDRAGTHASWAAAGMLSPQAEADRPGPFLELLRASRALYPRFAAALREETGVDVAYRDEGTLVLALDEADEAVMDARYRWQRAAGLPVERLDAAAALRLEPALTPALRWALRFPEDHQVDNRLLARALRDAAVRAGARLREGCGVRRLLRRGGRAAGVELSDGERVEGEVVVLAAGTWSGGVEGLPTPLPVRPVHGQLVALGTLPPPIRHVLHSPHGYLVPRADGRVIVGATMEDTGFRTAVTAGGLLGLLRAGIEAVPALRDAPVAEHWSGLRPGTPDGLPILGRDPLLPGLVYATGHFRNGILLAPVTAEAVGALVVGNDPGSGLAPFAVERFRGVPPTARASEPGLP